MAMRERWGDLDVEDTAAGVRPWWLATCVDPRRVVAIGASAGGFTTFGLLARHPDLFAAGVVLYGVADLLQLDEGSHRFEPHYNHTLVGPLPASVDRYRSRSPLHYAGDITAPLLVLQGTDDVVVPPDAVAGDRGPAPRRSDARSSTTSTRGRGTAGPGPRPWSTSWSAPTTSCAAMSYGGAMSTRVCPVCGADYLDWALACTACGVSLVPASEAPDPLRLPEHEQVVYELGEWPLGLQAAAAQAMAESGIPHGWSGTDLVVQLDHEPEPSTRCSRRSRSPSPAWSAPTTSTRTSPLAPAAAPARWPTRTSDGRRRRPRRRRRRDIESTTMLRAPTPS